MDGSTAAYTVTVIPQDLLDYLAALLAAAPGGDSPANPASLPVDMALTAAGWTALLTVIDNADKYVALDPLGLRPGNPQFRRRPLCRWDL
ncbi:MAG: hypothetical protein LBP23_04380 [Treponema sp.]|nr:hypothetical protein [Treponema sp.]